MAGPVNAEAAADVKRIYGEYAQLTPVKLVDPASLLATVADDPAS
ncbi:hypothetical protein ABN028_29910 [Actinopolymorpha sp. B17G11]